MDKVTLGDVTAKATKRVKLSDVIFRANAKVDKDHTDLIYYVGGEHIDSENIKVNRRGLIQGSTIGPMFYYGFKAGDFLLVSRNPHLKKAGVVDFDGICSEKTFVLETINPSALLPEFLPFILQNEAFWEYACQHKHGSTNTFINWSTLANYEFELPDLETQRKLSQVLWAIVDTMEAYKRLISVTYELVSSQFVEMFGPLVGNTKWETWKLLDFGENLDSRRIPITSGSRKKGPYPYYGASGIIDYVDSYIFDEDILLISEDGANLLARVTPIAFSAHGKVWVNNHAHVMRFQNPATQCYIEKYLNYIDISNYVTGTAQPKLNQENLNNIPIPLPPLDLQERFAAFVEQSDKSKFALSQALADLTATYKRIIAENLG